MDKGRNRGTKPWNRERKSDAKRKDVQVRKRDGVCSLGRAEVVSCLARLLGGTRWSGEKCQDTIRLGREEDYISCKRLEVYLSPQHI